MTTPLTDTTADGSILVGITIHRQDGDRWGFSEDFRADFPESEGQYGNNTIAEALRERVRAAGIRGVDIDSEFSCLYVEARTSAQVQRVVDTLHAMRDEGMFGALDPKVRKITDGLVPSLFEIAALIGWLRETPADITMTSMRRDGALVVQWVDAHGDQHAVVEGAALPEGNKVDSNGAIL